MAKVCPITFLLLNDASAHGLTLPDAVKAYKLLKKASLEQSQRQMVLSSVQLLTLEYQAIKSSSKRKFVTNDEKTGMKKVLVKEEPIFATNVQNIKVNFWGKELGSSQNGINPMNKDGYRYRCTLCGSTYHFAKDCPETPQLATTKVRLDYADGEQNGTSAGFATSTMETCHTFCVFRIP